MGRLNKLRAWIYLRAGTYLRAMGESEADVLAMGDDRLKVIALTTILAASRRGKDADEAVEIAKRLAKEVEMCGYDLEREFVDARDEIDWHISQLIRDQAAVPPREAPGPSGDVPGRK